MVCLPSCRQLSACLLACLLAWLQEAAVVPWPTQHAQRSSNPSACPTAKCNAGEGVADAFITIARDVMEERQQYQQQQRSWGGRTSRRSSQDGSASPFAAATGATHACPPLALRLPQRPRSAAAEAGGSSRGRARAAGGVGLGAHRALSVQPVGGRRQQQQASHEYEVGGSELGLPERQEEPSCRIS